MVREIEQFLAEHMDLSDRETLKAVSIAEGSTQNRYLISLTGQLYDKIQEKVTRIDFSSVSKSKGDITKIQNYETLVETLDIMRNIVIEYKQDPMYVDAILTAIENLKKRQAMFKKAFTIGASLPVLTYNTVALAIVQSTSFLIATCIEFVKDPKVDSFKTAIDTVAYNKTKDNVLYESIFLFNKGCVSGEFDNAVNYVMNQAIATREAAEEEAIIAQDSPFLTDEEIENGENNTVVVHDMKEKGEISSYNEGMGSVLGYIGAKAVLGIANIIIPIIRSITYFFFSSKQKISDYYGDQANLIQMNAYQLQYNTSMTDSQRKAIYKKQMEIVNKYQKRANELSIDYKKATVDSDRMQKEERKKYKATEIDINDHNALASSNIFEAEITNNIHAKIVNVYTGDKAKDDKEIDIHKCIDDDGHVSPIEIDCDDDDDEEENEKPVEKVDVPTPNEVWAETFVRVPDGDYLYEDSIDMGNQNNSEEQQGPKNAPNVQSSPQNGEDNDNVNGEATG